ncbi:MAG: hypothetical protein ACFCU4_09350 [Puniceicoccaceae bacterium]
MNEQPHQRRAKLPRQGCHSKPDNPSVGGFALVVSLSLMTFVLLLLVSLSSFTSVETRTSFNQRDRIIAQANARLAAQVALGQLQNYAGSDQRITAPAALVPGAISPHLVGVWDSRTEPPLNPTTPLVWLISGNENPADPRRVSPLTTIANSPLNARMVGEHSIGDNSSLWQYAPKVFTDFGEDSGAYAYLVLDEGLKARANLSTAAFQSSPSPEIPAPILAQAFAGAPRFALEKMERAPLFSTGAHTDSWSSDLFPFDRSDLSILNTSGDLWSLAQNPTVAGASKARFNDLTYVSRSLLTNPVNGGFKLDLNRALEASLPSLPDSQFVFPPQAPITGSEAQKRPTNWGDLRRWYNNPIDPEGGQLTAQRPTLFSPGLGPVMVWAELGLSVFYEDRGPPDRPTRYFLRAQFFPKVVLWNPYSVPLAGRNYEIGFSSLLTNSDEAAIRIEETAPPHRYLRLFSLYSMTFENGIRSKPSRYLRFRVNMPTLDPGVAKVFTPAAVNTFYNSNGSIELSEGDFSNSVIVDSLSFNLPASPPFRATFFSGDTSDGAATSARVPGQYMAYFRFDNAGGGPPSDPIPPDPHQRPQDTFQFIQSLQIDQTGVIGGADLLNVPQGPTIEPMVRLLLRARMGAAHPAFPQRWLANGNPLGRLLGKFNNYPAHPLFVSGLYSNTDGQTQLSSGVNNRVSLTPDFLPDDSGDYVAMALREPSLLDRGLYQSVAQLQHVATHHAGFGPVNAIGNSLQDFNIPRTSTFISTGNESAPAHYDYSYLLNEALWDQTFFSTIPADLSDANLANPAFQFPNPRIIPTSEATAESLLSPEGAASQLWLLGGFNINSTSEQAWRSFLGSLNGLPYDPVTGLAAPGDPLKNPFSRFQRPPAASDDPWLGYRQLTDEEIASLAAAIVTEITIHGPFSSLADFINRRLRNDDSGLKGRLQAAIDRADQSTVPINDRYPFNQDLPADPEILLLPAAIDREAFVGSSSGLALPSASRNVFSPGYLSQADLLSRFGGVLTARSDTFVIRAYGEKRAPGGEVEASSWVEMVVQRLPELMEPSLDPHHRKFSVISFRYLDEI